MKQLYLCGAISNNPNYKQDFETAYNKLQKAGYAIVSPLYFCNEQWCWEQCMRECIRVLSTKKAIAIIGDISNSKGARLEVEIGKALGMEIKSVDEWTKEAFRSAWNKAGPKERKKFLELPNWDNEVFKELSGIDAEAEIAKENQE